MLSLDWRTRQRDGIRTVRDYLDFLADGRSLKDRLAPGDFVSVLDGGFTERERIAALLLEGPSELPTGRVPLYVCPECGDVDCGAIAARVEETEDAFVWSDFTVEVTYYFDSEDERVQERITGVEPVAFEKDQYRAVLAERLAQAAV